MPLPLERSSHAATSTTSSPYVTLEPAGPHGQIPGDASDPADFYGIVVALAAIVLVVVVVRWIFRSQHHSAQDPPSSR